MKLLSIKTKAPSQSLSDRISKLFTREIQGLRLFYPEKWTKSVGFWTLKKEVVIY